MSMDEKKAELEALVNAGKLSPEEAMAYAEKLGLVRTERTVSLSQATTKLFNFSVLKWTKGRTVQRLILQFDFSSQTLSSIQHGTRTKKVDFREISSYQSDDGMRLFVWFASQAEYELDADTQEDKNKMCRLLQAIVSKHQDHPGLEEDSMDTLSPVRIPSPEVTTHQPTLATPTLVQDSAAAFIMPAETEQSVSPTALPLPDDQAARSSVLLPSLSWQLIKEGLVEKKGHSVAFLMWPKRYLRVNEGELLYYKPDDLENALNIIPLNHSVTQVKKLDYNGFVVTLTGTKKQFSFRTVSTIGAEKTPQQERDEWVQAITEGCMRRRHSEASLRRGTVTAKVIMEERERGKTLSSKVMSKLIPIKKQASVALENGSVAASPPQTTTITQPPTSAAVATDSDPQPQLSTSPPTSTIMATSPGGSAGSTPSPIAARKANEKPTSPSPPVLRRIREKQLERDKATSPPPPSSKKDNSSVVRRTKSLSAKVSDRFRRSVKRSPATPPEPEPEDSERVRSLTSSTFYHSVDITTPVSQPIDFKPLDLKDKKMDEVLRMASQEYQSLSEIVREYTTGSSEVDMRMTRVWSIIRALEDQYSVTTGETFSPTPSVSSADREANGRLSPVREEAKEPSPLRHSQSSAPSSSSSSSSSARGSLSPHGPSPSPSPLPSTDEVAGSDALDQLMLDAQRANDSSHEATPLSDDTTASEHAAAMGVTSREHGSLTSPEHGSTGDGSVGSPEPGSESGLSLQLTESNSVKSGQASAVQSPDPSHHSTPATSPQGLPPAGGPPLPPPLPPGVPAPPLPPVPGGVPPPPPPGFGFQLPPLLPQRKDPVPSVKMRKFYWTPLPQQTVIKSGWMDWTSKEMAGLMNLKELEQLFGVNEDKSRQAAKKVVVQRKTLIDTTRSRNIEIFLPSFPLALESLDRTLNEHLNSVSADSPLGLEHIVALKRYQPTTEEREMYKNFKGDLGILQTADVFLIKLCEIPFLSTRLDLLFTVRDFPANFEGFEPTLNLAWQACSELHNSTAFVDLLQYVLAIGNYMNAGSKQGGAYGFKLAVLPKLAETYGHDKKTSLLHYLLTQLHQHRPALLDCHKSLVAVSKASDISITGISAELEVMQKELDRIERYGKQVTEKASLSKSAGEALLKDIQEFVSKHRVLLNTAVTKGHEMVDTYRVLLDKFGEPPGTDSEDFFSNIAKFISQFTRVHNEFYPPKPQPSPCVQRRKDDKLSSQQLAQSTDSVDGVKPPKSPLTKKNTPVSADEVKKVANAVPAMEHISSTKRSSQGTIPTRNLQPREGYLEKQTKDKKRYEKKYFELENRNLHYYNVSGRNHRYANTIRLYGIPVSLSSEDARVVLIETDERVWQLRAETEETAADWVGVLKIHSQGVGR